MKKNHKEKKLKTLLWYDLIIGKITLLTRPFYGREQFDQAFLLLVRPSKEFFP